MSDVTYDSVHILTVDTITLATCALLVKKALVELLLLPFTVVKVIFSRFEDLQNCHMVHEDAIHVPTFYAPCIDVHELIKVNIMTVIVAMFFGGIHCAGWNFPFPCQADLIIWHVSSLIIVIVPLTFVHLIVQWNMGINTIAQGCSSNRMPDLYPVS